MATWRCGKTIGIPRRDDAVDVISSKAFSLRLRCPLTEPASIRLVSRLPRGLTVPFTPFHMGPGLLLKALLQGSFSLLIFGWTQLIMDLQPLAAILSGNGQLHGFTHTYLGAILIAVISTFSGKYAAQFALRLLGLLHQIPILWRTATISALIGSFSHVLLDSLMHADLQPFAPFSAANPFLHAVTVNALHLFCLYSGLIGTMLYFAIGFRMRKAKKSARRNVTERSQPR